MKKKKPAGKGGQKEYPVTKIYSGGTVEVRKTLVSRKSNAAKPCDKKKLKTILETNFTNSQRFFECQLRSEQRAIQSSEGACCKPFGYQERDRDQGQ